MLGVIWQDKVNLSTPVLIDMNFRQLLVKTKIFPVAYKGRVNFLSIRRIIILVVRLAGRKDCEKGSTGSRHPNKHFLFHKICRFIIYKYNYNSQKINYFARECTK